MLRLIAAILLATWILAAGGGAPVAAHPVRPVHQSADELRARPTSAHPDEATVAPASVHPDGATVTPASAAHDGPHQLPGPAFSPDAAPPSPLAITGALIALAILLVAVGGRRRAVALGLALVLGVLAFESAVHSVHHLGSSKESQCAVAAAAAHIQATVGEPVSALAAPVYAGPVSIAVDPARRAAQSWRAGRSRAPPSPSPPSPPLG